MLNPRNPRTPRSGHDHVPTHVPAPCRFCLTTDNDARQLERHAQKGPPSPVPHGKNLTRLFTMGRVQPRSLRNRGGTWYFLASIFPLCPRNRCITEPFCPLIATVSVCFRATYPPTCTGIGKTCHRVATGTVYCPPCSAPAPVTGMVRHASH